MATEAQPGRPVRRFIAPTLWTFLGVILAMLLYGVCQGVFAGYPQYHTDLFSKIGMALIALTGGAAWIIDQRRIDDDD
jgi:hypothetical protein